MASVGDFSWVMLYVVEGNMVLNVVHNNNNNKIIERAVVCSQERKVRGFLCTILDFLRCFVSSVLFQLKQRI